MRMQLCCAVAVFTACAGGSEGETVITDFRDNGRVVWTTTWEKAVYDVEWAPTLADPWTNSWRQLQGQLATQSIVTNAVPMFYRVRVREGGLNSPLCDYTFEEGTGATVHDVAGAGSPIDLTISNTNNVTWLPGALRLDDTAIVSAGDPAELHAACTTSEEMTLASWVTPANTTMSGPARVVTFSGGNSLRNFTLGVSGTSWEMRRRSTFYGDNGTPSVVLVGFLDTNLTHVVYTRHATGEEEVYVNGIERASGFCLGSFDNWNADYTFALGNETDMARQFYGTYYRVTIYTNALSRGEIEWLYKQGP